MSKRIFGLLAILCLIAVAAVGCDRDSNGGAGDHPSGLEPYHIIWWMPDNFQNQHEIDLVAERANEISMERYNATVEFRHIPVADYAERMNLITQAGEEFDVAFTSSWTVDFRMLAAREAVIPLQELINQHGQDMVRDFPDFLWDGVRFAGDIYAVPTYKDLGVPNAMLINTVVAEYHGFDLSNVRRFEDMEPFFEIVQAANADDPGFVVFTPGMPHNIATYRTAPVELILSGFPAVIRPDDPTLTVQNLFEVDEFLDYSLPLFRSWNERGFIRRDWLTAPEPDWPQQRWFAMTIRLPAYGEVRMGMIWGIPVDIIRFGHAASYGTGRGYITYDDIAASVMSISSTSADPARAMMVLNMFNTDPEYKNIVINGIEDRHFTRVSDNVVDRTDAPYLWELNNWMWGNIFINYLYAADPPGLNDAIRRETAEAYRSPLMGFAFDPDPVRTEIAAVNSVMAELRAPIWSGSVDPDVYVPIVNERLERAGLDVVMAEMQRQIDAWRGN